MTNRLKAILLFLLVILTLRGNKDYYEYFTYQRISFQQSSNYELNSQINLALFSIQRDCNIRNSERKVSEIKSTVDFAFNKLDLKDLNPAQIDFSFDFDQTSFTFNSYIRQIIYPFHSFS